MYNDDTELIFPSRVIPELRAERGKDWRKLCDKVDKKEESTPEHLAFVLMMARLNGCNSCSSDSFRAMRGCTQCALQNVRRYKGDDKKLLSLYDKASEDLNKKLAKKK